MLAALQIIVTLMAWDLHGIEEVAVSTRVHAASRWSHVISISRATLNLRKGQHHGPYPWRLDSSRDTRRDSPLDRTLRM